MFHRLPLDPPSTAEQLVARACTLRIDLIKFQDEDGGNHVTAEYMIGGQLDLFPAGASDLARLTDLIRQFLQTAEGGAL